MDPTEEGLGRATIMSRQMASRHGVSFVHLAVVAIDLDRICEAVSDEDGDETQWPFGWEVFLLARYLERELRPDAQRELVEEACALSIELGDVLGSQLPFAVHALVATGRWPATLGDIFSAWKRSPKELTKRLAPLWAEPEEATRRLAAACLEVPLEPPLAPPARQALEALSA